MKAGEACEADSLAAMESFRVEITRRGAAASHVRRQAGGRSAGRRGKTRDDQGRPEKAGFARGLKQQGPVQS